MPGPRSQGAVVDRTGAESVEPTSEPFHLGPGIRRDERCSKWSGPFPRALEADLRIAVDGVAHIPGALGQEHRLLVDVGPHGRAVLAHEVLEVGLLPQDPAGLAVGAGLE